MRNDCNSKTENIQYCKFTNFCENEWKRQVSLNLEIILQQVKTIIIKCQVIKILNNLKNSYITLNIYMRLPINPTKVNFETVQNIINITEGLKTSNLPKACFYIQLKIDKERIPGRRLWIVHKLSNCPMSRILEYVNFHQQPTFKKIPSYIQGKRNFLEN